ncbi:MAG: tetratricopeptide repeat protein [Pseudomonadota bacterium]
MNQADGREREVRLDALLDEALTLEDDARDDLLRRLVAEDPTLAEELRALLALATTDDAALPLSANGPARWSALFDASAPDTDAVALPGRIGVWTPVACIGHGGMGAVYRVERDADGFHQTGALKLLRPGTESDAFLRRFTEERRILATLTHPGIARLLDGGRSAGGQPYLVMEYVDGAPLDRACDARRLDIDARIALFLRIADAVAHAHRNLVAHRDLKPGNILVGADGAPKLLDFGIAKAFEASADATAADKPAVDERTTTHTLLRAFTPDYAAPEQVLGQPTSTATDIYQLGLLLYELLTGHRAQHARDASPRAIEAAVCESEPVRPSERVGDDDRERCAARATTPCALRRKLRGDLDNIVLKSLRKAPERRYGSVGALIEDLERWRRGQTVRARPETWTYRTGKFLRRNAWAVAATTTIFALVLGYATTAILQADALARERDRARAEATKARQIATLTRRLFEGAGPNVAGESPLTARQLLDNGWPLIERELEGQPDVQAELLDVVAGAYRDLGEYDRAETLADGGLRAAARVVEQPALLTRARHTRGRVAIDRGDYAVAEMHLGGALDDYRRTRGRDSAEAADVLQDLAELADLRGDVAAAQAGYRDALAIRRARHGERHPDVAESLHGLGMSLRRAGDYKGAEPLVSQALTLRRQLLPAGHAAIAYTLSDLAQIRNDLGEYDSAEALYREALASQEKSLGPGHPDVATTLITLARVLKTRRDLEGARALLERALAIRIRTHGERHPMVALNLNDLGRNRFESGDLDGAEAYYRRALAAYRPDDPGRPPVAFNLGELAEKRGDAAEAERRYRETLAAWRARYGEDHDRVGMVWNRIGALLFRAADKGRWDEAEAAMRRGVAIYRKRLPPEHPKFASALLPLGTLLIARGKRDEGETLLRDAWRLRRDAFGAQDPRTRDAAQALAAVGLPTPAK